LSTIPYARKEEQRRKEVAERNRNNDMAKKTRSKQSWSDGKVFVPGSN
jgi:hypothetical protein